MMVVCRFFGRVIFMVGEEFELSKENVETISP